ncbi:hypothetical protein LZD49_06625 [Dyadobacter sp. CY261]|uniref:hypothetical protein n=1 Tax=Dyadobacter sp. CY261 TaxID=2907203 RepID=UPI001F2CF6C6|nr:hypothetical protein [Dyadobacter sp. CY261]MCF0070139.1 hypothetical protein [Dyadobacter sp. CY261]
MQVDQVMADEQAIYQIWRLSERLNDLPAFPDYYPALKADRKATSENAVRHGELSAKFNKINT